MSSRYEIWGMDKSVDTAARHLIVSNTSDPLNGHIIPAKRLHRIFWNLLEHSRMLYVPNFQNIPDYSRTSSNIPCSNVPESSRMLSNVLGHYFGTEGSVSNSVLAVRESIPILLPISVPICVKPSHCGIFYSFSILPNTTQVVMLSCSCATTAVPVKGA